MSTNEKTSVVDESEIEAAMAEAVNGTDQFTRTLRKPVHFEGEVFETLTFDFGRLTAADSLNIEAELAAMNRVVIVPEFSGDYLLRMAMRACTNRRKDGRKLGIDFFQALSLGDYVKIRGKARSFLLAAGS